MSPLVEALAAALLLANVWLVARRSLWNYAFALAAVSLYAAVFLDARLYAAFGLQLVFLALNIYGLASWRAARSGSGPVAVSHLTPRWILVSLAAILVLAFGIGQMLAATTDAEAPFWDSLNTSAALCAQWWQARRKVESWGFWLLVNIGSTGLYAMQGLWFTAAVYAVLLAMALHGWRSWNRAASQTGQTGLG